MKTDSDLAITVVGSINVDFSVTADRLPKPGESVIGDEFLQAFGGKGANQAVGVSRLANREVRFIGAVGDDELGRAGIESLQQSGIDTQFVRTAKGVGTGVALIMIDQRGENSIVAAPGANAFVDVDYVRSLPDEVFQSTAMLVLCQEIPVEALEEIAKRAKSFGIPVLFNPAPPNPRLTQTDLLNYVDYLTPNQTEAASIVGEEVESLDSEPGQLGVMEKLSQVGGFSVAMTLGKSGCLVFDRNQMGSPSEAALVAAPQVHSIDATAAGDSFNAALAVALTEGKAFLDACAWANQCAAISVTRRGAQPSLPYRHDLPQEHR